MNSNGRLKEKIAVITGAASGIGRATAILFAREGANLVLVDVQETGLKETLAAVKEAGGEAVIIPGDVSVEQEVKALNALGLNTYGRIDILINNAGVTGRMVGLE